MFVSLMQQGLHDVRQGDVLACEGKVKEEDERGVGVGVGVGDVLV